MSESNQPMPTNGEPQEKAPPYVAVVKTQGACQVQHNLLDPWLALALLRMGEHALLEGMKPVLIKPNGFPAGMLAKMGRG